MNKFERMLKQMERYKIKNPSFTRKCINTFFDYMDEYFFDQIDKVSSFFHNIKKGIKNLIEYGPTIYKDRDWDHYYLLKLMDIKLKKMYTDLSTQEFAQIHKNNLKALKICSVLTTRLMNDEYDIEDDEFIKKWGTLEFVDNSIKRTKKITDKERNQYQIELKNRINRIENRRKNDQELLFKLMNKHFRSWWW